MRLQTTFVALCLVCASSVPVPAAAADPVVVGAWAEPFWEGGDEPFNPPSVERSARYPAAGTMVVLPDGRVLYWNGFENLESLSGNGFTNGYRTRNSRTRVLDPVRKTWTIPSPEYGYTDKIGPSLENLFCADQKLLHDGTVLAAGGHELRDGGVYGDDQSATFDPSADAWTRTGALNRPRWYPGMVTTADGKVLIVSGNELRGFEPVTGELVREVERYDPATRQWDVAGASELSLPLYPRMHLLPGGKVFYGGAGTFDGTDQGALDHATWGLQRLFDPETGEWEILGMSRYGARDDAFSVLLRLEAPYDEATVLIGGGTMGPTPGTLVGSTLSELVRIRGDEVENEAQPKAPLAGLAGDESQLRRGRWSGTSVLLPTGEVALFSGADLDELWHPGLDGAVRTAELYDPSTNTWSELAPAARDRSYHNTAVLLADGRILVGGHIPLPGHNHRYGTPLPTRSNNLRDSTFEIFSPPYLFRGPRPEILDLQATADGKALRVVSDTELSDVVLVRLGAATHSSDSDARAVSLTLEETDGGILASLPNDGDGSLVPPGPYHVFAMRETPEGPVPSVAEVVMVSPAGGGKVRVEG